MNKPDKICDNITDSIDELLTSVDAMRWTPSGDATTGAPAAVSGSATSGVEPADLKERFDALYETIDAFAGAVDDRLRTFADKVEGAFAEPSTPTPPAPAPAHRAVTDDGS